MASGVGAPTFGQLVLKLSSDNRPGLQVFTCNIIYSSICADETGNNQSWEQPGLPREEDAENNTLFGFGLRIPSDQCFAAGRYPQGH